MTEQTPSRLLAENAILAIDGVLKQQTPAARTAFEIIKRALQSERDSTERLVREAVERAAKIAEERGGPGGGEHASARETSYLVGREIAAAIRAMASPKGET